MSSTPGCSNTGKDETKLQNSLENKSSQNAGKFSVAILTIGSLDTAVKKDPEESTDSGEKGAVVKKDSQTAHFQCPICAKTFPSHSHLVTHDHVHGSIFPVLCNICGMDLADAGAIANHLNQHMVIGLWSCLKCNRALSTRQSLQRHMAQQRHIAGQHVKGAYPLVCNICNKKFNWRSALEWHMNLHTGEEPFHCKRCDASFKRPSQLKAHLLSHDGRKMYECSECSKTFWLRSAMITHLTNHVLESRGETKPPPTYDCEICGKEFNAKAYLSNHLRTHKDEKGLKKQFTCERCKRTFTTRAHLIIHEQTHDGGGLVCPVCDKKFKTISWLQFHMRIHTAESPVCPLCNKSFTIQRSLEEHMAFHNEQKKVEVTCPSCKTKFRSERSYLRHKGKCRGAFDGEICRICGLGFTTAEKHNDHSLVCDVKQNRRTTENVDTSVLPIIKSEVEGEEESMNEDQVLVMTAEESEMSNEASQNTIFITEDNSDLLFQNVLEAVESERYMVNNSVTTEVVESTVCEDPTPTDVLIEGPNGLMLVQVYYQTVG